MTLTFLKLVAIATVVITTSTANAATLRSKRIDIKYVPPKLNEHAPVYQLMKEKRVLEKIRELLNPLRLPRRLLLTTQGCDGESNAWYDSESHSITVCYEFIDDIWKNVPRETTSGGVAPIDAFIGPLVDVFLHEAGHAVFHLLRIPILGREEDAADQFSAYIMLRFSKAEARRLILGNAYQYKFDMKLEMATTSLEKFANEHGNAAQRFYNVLCIAYGADQRLFGDFVEKGYLPSGRAEGCEEEYQKIDYAFAKLIAPYINHKLADKLNKRWLPKIDTAAPRKK